MNKSIFIIAITLIISLNLFSNEKTTTAISDDLNFAIANNNPSVIKVSSSSQMKDPDQMIRLGRYLTITGISAFGTSTLFLSAAVILTYFAWNELDPALWNETYKNRNSFWYSLMMQKNNDKLTWLAAFAMTSYVFGGLMLLMTAMIIPGIILWAIGAGARTKKSDNAESSNTSFRPFVDGNKFGLSISL